MQFNDSSNGTGIVQDIYFLTGADTTSYPLSDLTRNVNRWLSIASIEQIKANKDWAFHDSNYTTHNIADTTLVDSQNDYTLPSTLLTLERVEVKDSNGLWHRVRKISKKKISQAIGEFEKTDSLPKYYYLQGNSIFLYPAPSSTYVTTTNGLRIYYTKEFSQFSSTDTTKSSWLPDPFDRIAVYGASYDYFFANEMDGKASVARQELEVLFGKFREFSAHRSEEERPSFSPAHSTIFYE